MKNSNDPAPFELKRVKVDLGSLVGTVRELRFALAIRRLNAWLMAGERRSVRGRERIAGVHYVELFEGERMVARGPGRDDLEALFKALEIAEARKEA